MWNEVPEQEFNETKTAICKAVTLAHLNLIEEFTVDVDASDNALGVVIFQAHGVIECYSRVLTSAERSIQQTGKNYWLYCLVFIRGRKN